MVSVAIPLAQAMTAAIELTWKSEARPTGITGHLLFVCSHRPSL